MSLDAAATWRETGTIEVEEVEYPVFGNDFAVFCAWKNSKSAILQPEEKESKAEMLSFLRVTRPTIIE